jgi:hypothetical protein
MPRKTAPFQYLLECSQMSLEDFELARLDRAGNLRKQLRDIAEEWVEAAVEARLAQWVRENRHRSDGRAVTFREYKGSARPRLRALSVSDASSELEFSTAKNSRGTVGPPRPPKLRRDALTIALPPPVSISTHQRCSREPAHIEFVHSSRDQHHPRVGTVRMPPEEQVVRPDAFAAVRYFR